MTLIRRAMLVVAALLLAGLAVRVAVVLAFGTERPALAAAVWADHPTVRMDSGLRAIGRSVASGRAPPPAVAADLRGLLARDPINPGPLLVAGTDAFARDDLPGAERLLLAASRLDPFAPAPRFLLAQLYLRQNRGARGLAQLGFLFDRLNGDAAPLVPALASYAAQPGAAPQLKPLLDRQPAIRSQVLSLLADQPANLSTILSLAPRVASDADTEWRQRLLTALVERRDYARAYALWRQFGHVPAAAPTAIFNPRFLPGGPPPPFNWRLNATPAGTAEARPGGGLHLLYFGREDAVLAEQILLLAPGRYHLAFTTQGDTSGLSWALTCLPGSARQEAPLASHGFDLVVPRQGCAAQRLELRGGMGDYSMTVDASLSPVVLRGGGGA